MKKSFPWIVIVACALGWAFQSVAADPVLPWQREIPLREAAQSVFLRSTLETNSPFPTMTPFGGTDALTINNLKMRTMILGHTESHHDPSYEKRRLGPTPQCSIT
jgi:hypothetical protein